MKKLLYLLAAACLLPLSTALAQSSTTKGTRTFGLSNFGSNYFSANGYSTRLALGLNPSFGKFFADDWAFGVDVPLSYGFTRYKQSAQRNRDLAVGAMPWLRYYIPSESRHRVFLQAQVGALLDNSWGRREEYDGITRRTVRYNNSDFGYLAGIGAGYSYFLTPAIGVEALLQYQSGGFGGVSGSSRSLGAQFGLRAYLPGKSAAVAPTE